jgi:putative phosphoribosyl transferase
MERETEHRSEEREVRISAGAIELEGHLGVVEGALGVVLFAHGSGSGRSSPRNFYVARVLRQAGLSTLLIDLLTAEEEAMDLRTRQLRFDIGLLAERLVGTTSWLRDDPGTQNKRIGYFGASTGAGAALVAAAERPNEVGAVVSRGGRPDLAGEALSRGGADAPDRWRQRRARNRDERRGSGAYACREAARDRSRSDSPLRGGGGSRGGGASGHRLVQTLPGPQRLGIASAPGSVLQVSVGMGSL